MRRVFLVTYDICDDARRGLVFRILCGFGEHLQFSVFCCETSDRELVRLKGRLAEAINSVEDQVLFADLGPVDGRGKSAITALGRSYSEPDRNATIY